MVLVWQFENYKVNILKTVPILCSISVIKLLIIVEGHLSTMLKANSTPLFPIIYNSLYNPTLKPKNDCNIKNYTSVPVN